MNCELPATGATVSVPVLIAVCLLVAGGGVLVFVRRASARSLLPALIVMAAAVGLSTSRPSEASSDCVTTTPAPATTPPPTAMSPSSAPTSTAPATTSTSTSTTTTTTSSTTTTTVPPTTVPVVAFCGTLTFADNTSLDVFISMEGGAGTYTALLPPTGGCDGEEVLDTGPAVDSNFFDPAVYCAENRAGSTPQQAIAAGTWTPSQPGDTWYACALTG